MVEREIQGEEAEEGLDTQRLRELIGFAVRAPARRPLLSTTVFALTAGLGLGVAVTMPRVYQAQTKILAQTNLVTPALTNPGRQVPRDADNPTKNVADMILRHDNLVSLVRDLDLAHRYYAARSPVMRVKDRLFGEPPTEEDRQRAVVSTLEKKLTVQTNDSTVTISVDWDDPQMAYDLANRIEKNFLEARYDDEVAMISDAVSVLQEHAKAQLDQLDAALAEYQKVLAELGPRVVERGGAPVVIFRGRSSGAAAMSVDPALTAALEEKRRQIRTFEDAYQRELESLEQQLMQAQLSLTSHHPTVIALQQKVDTLRQQPPELAQLKREERQLMAQIAPPAPREPAPGEDARVASNAPPPAPAQADDVPATAHWDDNGKARLARSRLEGAIRNYQDIEARIDSANIELEIARTAFKYRYTVVTPAEVPRHTKKPIAALVAASSVVAGVLLAVGAALLADRRKGKLVEEWQVRRGLGMEVLGELEMPGLS
jgi:uncharacterized protein involved in exopolysaccharide biosynthesis